MFCRFSTAEACASCDKVRMPRTANSCARCSRSYKTWYNRKNTYSCELAINTRLGRAADVRPGPTMPPPAIVTAAAVNWSVCQTSSAKRVGLTWRVIFVVVSDPANGSRPVVVVVVEVVVEVCVIAVAPRAVTSHRAAAPILLLLATAGVTAAEEEEEDEEEDKESLPPASDNTNAAAESDDDTEDAADDGNAAADEEEVRARATMSGSCAACTWARRAGNCG